MTAEQLRRALARLGISQREFARRLGVAPATVHRWIKGELPVPGYVAYVIKLLDCANETLLHEGVSG
jgi:transcriptional regulator with XRE-family HTH domain